MSDERNTFQSENNINRGRQSRYVNHPESLVFGTSGDKESFGKVCFGVDMAISICVWANYVECKVKLSRKSENAVANDRVLKFLFDDETQHIDAVVQASTRNMSYTVKVRCRHYMLQSALFVHARIRNCGSMNIFTRVYDGVM